MTSAETTAPTITGPCLVGRHDRCAGIIHSLINEANGQPCACPVEGCHNPEPAGDDDEEVAADAVAELAIERALEDSMFGEVAS